MIRISSLAILGTLAISTAAFAAMEKTDNLPEKGTVIIAGKVGTIEGGDQFTLNYDGGTIRVDTNDAWPNIFKKDANTATKQLTVGDNVVVTGKIDDNFFSKREIDAKSLRFEQGGQIFSYGDGAPKDAMNVSR